MKLGTTKNNSEDFAFFVRRNKLEENYVENNNCVRYFGIVRFDFNTISE